MALRACQYRYWFLLFAVTFLRVDQYDDATEGHLDVIEHTGVVG